jgi:hypothetical protein
MARYLARHLVRARILALAILIVALLGFAFPIPVKAQGIALSGDFYRQHFELIPGQSLTTPDIYVVVFNHGEQNLRVKLTTHAPLGVELILPTTDFTLPPGENRQLEVGINVGPQVGPGEYDLILTVEAYREGEGIKLTGAAQQQAKLSVIAEAGEVDISTVSPQGEPFPAIIRLYKQIEGQNLPCGYSETGKLQSKLTPGDYLVEAYFEGSKVAQETFSLAVDEKKTIALVPQTVFIEGFAVVRNYYTETGELAFAKIVYTINNMYQPLKDVTAVLKVSLEDKLVDETELISLPTLDVGKTGGAGYNYIPSQGWQHGTYIFKIELYSQGNIYAESQEVQMLTDPAKVSAPVNWPLIGGIIAGVVIIGVIAYLMVRRRRA